MISVGCKPKMTYTEPQIRPLSFREIYENSLAVDTTSSIETKMSWRAAALSALDDSVYIRPPFREQITASVDAMGISLKAILGEELVITLNHELLVDFWMTDSTDHLTLLVAPNTGVDTLIIPIDITGNYIVRLQPKLGESRPYSITIIRRSQNINPVQGADNEDVWSRFGDPREAGKRTHEGVDIFKRRGTPVVAASDGTVNVVRDEGLGGKQIWIKDARLNISHYYAHLDSQYVQEGALISQGDTIGTVGNTGNASTTRPHLHYGMYLRGQGAIDPFPFIEIPRVIRKFRASASVLPVILL